MENHFIVQWMVCNLAWPRSSLCMGNMNTTAQSGIDDPNWPKRCSILYNVLLSYKNRGKRGGKEDIHGYDVCFPKQLLCWGPASQRVAVCLLMGRKHGISLFALLMHTAFSPLSFYQPKSTTLLTFFMFSSCPVEGSEEKAGQVFDCWQGSTHHTQLLHLV